MPKLIAGLDVDDALILAGGLLVVVGLALIFVPLALIVAGGALVALGVFLGRS